MPPKAVKTIRELIYWTYAEQVIAPSAGFAKNYRFIMSRYQKLKKGEIQWSDIVTDDKKTAEQDDRCAYCGSRENLAWDHLIPLHRNGPNIFSNQVRSCQSCNSSKSDKDIFYWYGIDRKEEVPSLVLSKYLKLVHDYHEQSRSLDRSDLNKDGKLDVMDLAVFKIRTPVAKGET